MEHRYLGRSGLQVSSITYGNWITHGHGISDDAAKECIRAALDAGITTFDTADAYANGRAEEVLGSALRSERRESLVISTKVYFPVGPAPAGANESGLSRKHILDAVDASLHRLKMDYVDVYLAHRFDRFTPLEETVGAFGDVVRSGKARYIGVSEWPPGEVRTAQDMAQGLGFSLVCDQVQYSMLWRVIEAEVLPTCAELGIGITVWSPIAQGVLSGKYLPGQPAPTGSRGADPTAGAELIRRWLSPDVLHHVQALRPVADEIGLTMAQMALAWVLRNPAVASAVVGGSKPEQVAENVRATEIVLSDEVVAHIEAALADVVETDPALVLASTPNHRPR